MPVLDKERFNALVETEGWTLSTLSEFVGIFPRNLLSPKGIDVHTIELLGYLMDASVGFLLGTEEDKGAPEVDISLFGNFKAQPFTKEVDESCYKYAARDLGMSIDIFHKIMDGELGMPMKLSSRFHSIMASYNVPKEPIDRPIYGIQHYYAQPLMPQTMPDNISIPGMDPDERAQVKNILNLIANLNDCRSFVNISKYCKAKRKARAIDLMFENR